jgi:hypothetical protein
MTDLTDTASQLGAKVAEAQGRAEGLSRAASRKLDAARNEAAGALRSAASSVRSTADGAADKLDATASYVETYSGTGMLAGCRQLIRKNPAGSFLVATVIGFFAGSAVRHVLHSCAQKSDDV